MLSKIVCAAFVLIAANSFAGEIKGPQKKQELQFFKAAIEHAADLNLSADQKEKLIKLRDEANAAFDKLKDDPDLKSLLAQAREARKSGDPQKAKQLHKQLRDELEKKGGDPLTKAVEDGKAALTADQLAKLKEIIAGHPGKKAAAKETPEKATPLAEKPAATPAPAEPKPETVAKPESKEPAVDEDREALIELLKENHPEMYAKIVDGKDGE
jgi:hypothetical protein